MTLRTAGPAVDGSSIPQLQTERLLLRSFTLTDLDAAVAMWQEPGVVRYIGGNPRTRQEVWAAMQQRFGSWYLLGYGYWSICDRANGDYLGEIGFLDGVRGITPSIEGVPEAGWAFRGAAWGKGYATEALHAVLEWSDRTLDAKRTLCMIEPEHRASIRVAEKAGYRCYAQSSYKGRDIQLFERKVQPARR